MKRIDFEYRGWKCWMNSHGDWGASLSRKGMGLAIIDGKGSKNDLIAAIDVAMERRIMQ